MEGVTAIAQLHLHRVLESAGDHVVFVSSRTSTPRGRECSGDDGDDEDHRVPRRAMTHLKPEALQQCNAAPVIHPYSAPSSTSATSYALRDRVQRNAADAVAATHVRRRSSTRSRSGSAVFGGKVCDGISLCDARNDGTNDQIVTRSCSLRHSSGNVSRRSSGMTTVDSVLSTARHHRFTNNNQQQQRQQYVFGVSSNGVCTSPLCVVPVQLHSANACNAAVGTRTSANATAVISPTLWSGHGVSCNARSVSASAALQHTSRPPPCAARTPRTPLSDRTDDQGKECSDVHNGNGDNRGTNDVVQYDDDVAGGGCGMDKVANLTYWRTRACALQRQLRATQEQLRVTYNLYDDDVSTKATMATSTVTSAAKLSATDDNGRDACDAVRVDEVRLYEHDVDRDEGDGVGVQDGDAAMSTIPMLTALTVPPLMHVAALACEREQRYCIERDEGALRLQYYCAISAKLRSLNITAWQRHSNDTAKGTHVSFMTDASNSPANHVACVVDDEATARHRIVLDEQDALYEVLQRVDDVARLLWHAQASHATTRVASRAHSAFTSRSCSRENSHSNSRGAISVRRLLNELHVATGTLDTGKNCSHNATPHSEARTTLHIV